MSNITYQYGKVRKSIPKYVKLIAVSKTKPLEDILTLYHYGHKVFGENRVQELVTKYEALPKDIEWHLIGHLQTNKVKYIAPFVYLIHSVDSFKLLWEINKEAKKNNRIINCLLEIHIANEESKYGFSISEIEKLFEKNEFKAIHNVNICGVMGMATFTDNQQQIQNEFSTLKTYFQKLKKKCFYGNNIFKEISMGMSGDFELAIKEGSTMVRVGSLIFGNRKLSV